MHGREWDQLGRVVSEALGVYQERGGQWSSAGLALCQACARSPGCLLSLGWMLCPHLTDEETGSEK